MRSVVIAVLTMFLYTVAAYGAPEHPINVRDAARIVRLADPRISPDGKSIAAVETHADLETDEYVSEIILVDVASHQSRALTRARRHANSPRWSPSGDMIGFLAPDSNKIGQLFVMPMAGGDALQLTTGKDSISQFSWSPNGTQIAYAVEDAKPELTGEQKFRNAFPVGNDDVTITEAVRPTHIWLVSAQGGEAKRLTSGKWSLPSSLPPGSPSSPIEWSRDGKSIVFVRQETPSTGDQFDSQVQILDIAGGQIRSVTGDTRLEGYPKVSPDGTRIAYWRNRAAKPYMFQDVWLAPFAGGMGRDISAALEGNIYGTWWAPDGNSLLVGANIDTTVGLWRLKLDGSNERLKLNGIMPINGFWIDLDFGRQGEVAFIGQTKSDPYELYLMMPNGTPIALTDKNSGLADLTLARTETVAWKGPGGHMLDGVLTYPTTFQEGRKYPLVLYIHGGPNSSSRERFNLMPQALAAHGWLVFEPNYRGSDNSGNEFYASIFKDAGQGPGQDVMSGVEYLEHRGLADSARMAVTGWSYGGYMTTWLAGHYAGWKAAVAGAPVTDFVEMYDLSDGNVTIGEQQTGASPYIGDGMALNRRQSPASSAAKIRAPMLIMCDTGDFRVPIAQSFGLYRALKDNHVQTEFYAIPVGGHFPGDPIRQMDVYQRWIDWVARFL